MELLDTVEKLKSHFTYSKYTYFITIKPPRNQNRLKEVLDLCQTYLKKRHQCYYWIVPSISETDYLHYHGILGLNDNPKWDDHATRERFKKAFQRKVNRDIGFNHPLCRLDDFSRAHRYINRQRARKYEFREDVPIQYLSQVEVSCEGSEHD